MLQSGECKYSRKTKKKGNVGFTMPVNGSDCFSRGHVCREQWKWRRYILTKCLKNTLYQQCAYNRQQYSLSHTPRIFKVVLYLMKRQKKGLGLFLFLEAIRPGDSLVAFLIIWANFTVLAATCSLSAQTQRWYFSAHLTQGLNIWASSGDTWSLELKGCPKETSLKETESCCVSVAWNFWTCCCWATQRDPVSKSCCRSSDKASGSSCRVDTTSVIAD